MLVTMSGQNPKEILLIEDNALDARMTRDALKECPILIRLNVVTDGLEALEFLGGTGRHAGAPRPDLILLDLNLPGKDGREILSEIKSDANLRRIPVVVLSTSRATEDILKAYDLNANSYVSKPVELDLFTKAVQSIQQYWFATAKLPVSD
jgi:two-component system, chemotaxis family, response regulator Rcp1